MLDFITLTDGYKLDHRRQYPEGTEYVYSNFTPRSSRIPGCDWVTFFGLRYALAYLDELAEETFFTRRRSKVLNDYGRLLDSYLGEHSGIGVEHIGALWDYGKIPLVFHALSEGTRVPLRVPMFTVENTHPDFFWMTNYVETPLSSLLWLPCTSATTAVRYREIFKEYAQKTGAPVGGLSWQGHDFSFRGMSSPEAAAISGAAHLLSFTGTDCVPSLALLAKYYDGAGLIGGSVPATEHAVMCAGGKEDELLTIRRLLKLYPKGILSVVSDTWDLWNVVGNLLPQLKDEITARDGKLVVRPDSGNPALIIAGDPNARSALQHDGVIQTLWNHFGGTVNAQGYKVLDPHIGAIYGDSITESMGRDILERLAAKGFASGNIVLGIGSYTYQYVTRDTHGFAIKATWAQVNGRERLIYKDPITDNGVKRSARGRLVVWEDEGELRLLDGLTKQVQAEYADKNLLKPVWSEGRLLRRDTLAEIRARVKG